MTSAPTTPTATPTPTPTTPTAPSFLAAKDLSYYYQDGDSKRYVLADVNANFEKGSFYTILGESGSGKTTFLALLAALDSPHHGQVLLDGTPISAISQEKYRRNKVGIIFQSYNLIGYMTAAENVQVAMSITDNDLLRSDKAASKAELATVAYNLLDYLGITRDKADRRINQLSGGEQQRVAIARALATNVDLLLADEPTGNVNEEVEAELIDIFKRLAHDHNKCVIVVTHSSAIAAQSDISYRLYKGKLSINE